MRSSYVKGVIVTAVPTVLVFFAARAIRSALINPPGIPSPPIIPHEGDGFFTRNIRRFLMQHFYVVRKDESMFRLLQWTRLFNHHPFLMRIFFRPHIVISKSEDLEEVLLRQETSFCKRTGYDLLRTVIGDGLLAMVDKQKHRIHRRIIQPVFSSSNIRGIANEVMRVHVLRQLNIFHKLVLCAGDDGVVTINISEHMHRMALGVVSEAAFRASVEDSVVVLEAFSAMTKFNRLNYFCPYFRTRSQKEAENILLEVSNALMQNSEDDDGSVKRRVVLDALIDEFSVHFDKKDVVNHLITFLFAGHDTTSNTLNFLFALLARNERVQDRLYDELEMIMPGTCTCPTIEELLACEYLVAVVREAMRLFPTAPLIYRDALQDVHLPSSNVMIPKGSVCVLNIFGVHRSIAIYGDDADEFRPERWFNSEGRELRRRCGICGYMPFSAGNRSCIGKEYGYYEVLIATAVFIRHLRLEPVGAFPRTRFMFTMSSPDPCRVRLIRRPDVSTDSMLKGVQVEKEYETAKQFQTKCETLVV